MRRPTLDKFDIAILRVVQKNNQLTLDQISEKAHLSASACRRRLADLRASKVILAERAIVDPSAVGRPLLIAAFVKLERDAPDAHLAFSNLIDRTPEIIQAFFITGSSDYQLLLSIQDMDEYSDIAERLFTANNNVRTFETSVVLKRLKWGTALPI